MLDISQQDTDKSHGGVKHKTQLRYPNASICAQKDNKPQGRTKEKEHHADRSDTDWLLTPSMTKPTNIHFKPQCTWE